MGIFKKNEVKSANWTPLYTWTPFPISVPESLELPVVMATIYLWTETEKTHEMSQFMRFLKSLELPVVMATIYLWTTWNESVHEICEILGASSCHGNNISMNNMKWVCSWDLWNPLTFQLSWQTIYLWTTWNEPVHEICEILGASSCHGNKYIYEQHEMSLFMRFVKSLELPVVMATIYLWTVTEKQHQMSLSAHEMLMHMRIAKALVSLHFSAGSPEPSLLAHIM